MNTIRIPYRNLHATKGFMTPEWYTVSYSKLQLLNKYTLKS